MSLIETRQPVFDFYRSYEDPRFCITLPVVVPDFRPFCRREAVRSFQFLLHQIARTAFELPNFMLRHDEEGALYSAETLDVSYTALDLNRNVNFVVTPFELELKTFVVESEKRKLQVEGSTTLNIENRSHTNYLFVSALPWFEFTGIQNAVSSRASAQIPIVVFGRFTEVEGGLKIPFSVQGHHGLFDGMHIAQFVERLGETIRHTISG